MCSSDLLALIGLALANYLVERKSQLAKPLNFILGSGFYCFLLGFSVLLFRWPTFSLMECDPDESQAIAGAMRLAQDPVFWRSIDGTTHGPLLYYPLLLPKMIGLNIDYGAARLVGLLAEMASVLFLYASLRTLF